MSQKGNQYIIMIWMVLLTAAVLGLFYMMQSEKKTVYVDLNRLHDEFAMTQELENRFKQRMSNDQLVIDSLNLLIQQAQLNQSVTREAQAQQAYLAQSHYARIQELQNGQEILRGELEGQIWTQLNQYIKEYGEQSNTEYILGASGDGSILYAREENDRTSDVLEFVNLKYAGYEK